MTDDSTWFRRFQPADSAAHRLVCFPHAGGAASFFVPVARALAPGIDVYAVQYPGRHDRRDEPCIDDIAALADRLHAAMAAWDPRPLALFGHSMGAVVAYEVARRLRRDNPDLPLHLFASGRRAPHLQRPERVHRRDDAGIVAELRDLGGTDAALLGDPEILQLVLPALRSDYRAVETYRWEPGGPPPCPVTALTGDHDPHTTVEEAREWARHSKEPFSIRIFPGGHFFLLEHAPAVLTVIRERLSTMPRRDGSATFPSGGRCATG
ncbi:thioesterase II family protein [Couchioplanes caeruleus]|uniref:Surfactin synthase thioesterase subunit n=1 Tax=Couchioplanes caeruleus TaxID=56438 RepID=A0A3N1GEW8_9ACTN|nr:alpha/beta fold hydrolase [Couchioplanes caeruleus]ROP28849.1 surfactin synthase thioesterase subunit [Couchioplanes caeruleus]